MKNILLALVFLIGSALPAAAQGCGPQNPNCIVPTAPVGTCDSRAASTAYACQAGSGLVAPGTPGQIPTYNPPGTGLLDSASISTNQNMYFGSGRPWCDIRSQGAVQNGTWTGTAFTGTDDNPAWSACNTILSFLGGGIIYVPPSTGRSCLKSGGITLGPQVFIVGAGNGYSGNGNITNLQAPSVASSCGVDNTVFNFAGQGSGMSGMYVEGAPFGVTPAVIAAAVRVVIEHSTIEGGSPALKMAAGCAGVCVVANTNAQSSYGTANVYANAGFWGYQNIFDTTWFGIPAAGVVNAGAISAWAASTSYSSTAGASNNIVTMTGPDGNSYYVKVTVSGTSGSGSQPTVRPYGQTFVDGTVTWRLLRPVGAGGVFYDVQCDGCSNMELIQNDLSGAAVGIGFTNTVSAVPQDNFLISNTFGNNWGNGILAHDGWGVQVNGGYVNACTTTNCIGIQTTANWSSGLQIADVSMFSNPTGVSFGAGINSSLKGSQIFNASTAAVNVAANLTDVTIASNQLGSDGSLHGPNVNAAVLGTGTDYIIFLGNNCHGATAGLTNNGSGSHNYIPNGGNPGC